MTNNLQRAAGVAGTLARGEAINAAHPAPGVPQRPAGKLAQAAAGLSRRGIAAAKTELINGALLALVNLLYEADTDGRLCNVDPAGGRILVALPWGRVGCSLWGLRASEARALRYIMFNRTAIADPAPVLDYDAEGRHWFVNFTGGYTSLRRALAYLEHHPVTLQEWRQAWQATRTQWAAKELDGE